MKDQLIKDLRDEVEKILLNDNLSEDEKISLIQEIKALLDAADE